MKKNKIIYLFSVIVLISNLIIGCKKQEDITIEPAKPEKDLADFKIGNNYPKVVHLYSDTVYIISETSNFTRLDSQQLIIDAGTLIKVGNLTAKNYSAGGIDVRAGGSITANGTAQNPIVFTSVAPTGLQSTNWQGITIKGKSFNNTEGDTGIADDFSCSLKYVRVEFAALTLDGLGSKSVVENVQVSYANSRSAFSIMGGTFNARNLISYACGGANDFYIGMGYTGKMQNILAYRHPYFAKQGNGNIKAIAGMYIENGFNTQALPLTSPTISNLTIIGPQLQSGINIQYARSAALIATNNAKFKIKNSLILDYPVTTWVIYDSETYNNLLQKTASVDYSIFSEKTQQSTFFLNPQVTSNTSADFKNLVTASPNNTLIKTGAESFYNAPFNYENVNLSVIAGASIINKANFSDANFSDAFFEKVGYIGAVGNNNWWQGWTNFIPLRTNYNQAQ